jgi:hypothetical protein
MNNECYLKNIRILSWNAERLKKQKKIELLELVIRYQVDISFQKLKWKKV